MFTWLKKRRQRHECIENAQWVLKKLEASGVFDMAHVRKPVADLKRDGEMAMYRHADMNGYVDYVIVSLEHITEDADTTLRVVGIFELIPYKRVDVKVYDNVDKSNRDDVVRRIIEQYNDTQKAKKA